MYDVTNYFIKDPNAYYINSEGEVRCHSVHGRSNYRYLKAQDEAKKRPVPLQEIIDHVNHILGLLGIKCIENPIMNPATIDYGEIKRAYDLDDERDLIWLKFSTDGYIGVVAQSNDINFSYPASSTLYDKRENGNWKYNTSGIILHRLSKEWDRSFVLVFPLNRDRKNAYTRHEIETAVGNYLISQGVPILDYYSHNY